MSCSNITSYFKIHVVIFSSPISSRCSLNSYKDVRLLKDQHGISSFIVLIPNKPVLFSGPDESIFIDLGSFCWPAIGGLRPRSYALFCTHGVSVVVNFFAHKLLQFSCCELMSARKKMSGLKLESLLCALKWELYNIHILNCHLHSDLINNTIV